MITLHRMHIARWPSLALLTATLVALPPRGHAVVSAAPGDLDPAFGRGGTIVAAVDTGETRVHGLALQSDGRIIAVGQTSTYGGDIRLEDFAVVRLRSDGSPDYTFGPGGVVRTDFDGGADGAVDVAIQPDGRIVVLGFTISNSPDTESGTLLVRYNPDGTLDTTFGTNGTAFMQVPLSPAALALQPNGAIVVAGTSVFMGRPNYTDLALTRFHPDGSLDTSFGVDGRVTTDARGGSEEQLSDVALQDDGRIVALGRTFGPVGDAFELVRYMPDGTLDPSFGGDGKVVTFNHGYENEAHELAIQADGKLVVGGSTRMRPGNRRFYVQRYNTDGSFDASFSGDGKATFSLDGQASAAQSMVVDRVGRIILAGRVRNGAGEDDFAVTRVNADGTVDTSFGTGGWATADVSPSDVATDVLLQPDGKVLIAGEVWDRYVRDLALARFNGGVAHAAVFFPHATDAPPATSDLAMTPAAPVPQPLTVDATSVSWLSGPMTGRFPRTTSPPPDASPIFRFVTPCTAASAAGKTVRLSSTDVDGGDERPVGSGESAGPCGLTEVIEIPLSASVTLTNRRLKLTVSSSAGVHLQLGPRTFVSARAFEGGQP